MGSGPDLSLQSFRHVISIHTYRNIDPFSIEQKTFVALPLALTYNTIPVLEQRITYSQRLRALTTLVLRPPFHLALTCVLHLDGVCIELIPIKMLV